MLSFPTSEITAVMLFFHFILKLKPIYDFEPIGKTQCLRSWHHFLTMFVRIPREWYHLLEVEFCWFSHWRSHLGSISPISLVGHSGSSGVWLRLR